MSIAVRFKQVDVLFGGDQQAAINGLDQGLGRQAIAEQTGAVVGVADATLDVAAGEICVLMGLSGSGKSSLLRTVNGLNSITRGEVIVNTRNAEHSIGRCNTRDLRQLRQGGVAMVFQQFALLPWRTVRENVGLGLELRGVRGAELAATVDRQLETVGLTGWGDRYASELSGGMQQRVGLARAFATDADILLMDEPFSALDPLIRSHLQDELLELQKTLKKTILFVSHDLDEAFKLGNQVAIMEEARIVQAGPPTEIWRNPQTDYVRRFVARLNPLEALDAASLMRSARDDETLDLLPRVQASATLREVISVRQPGKAIAVENADQQMIGVIDSDDLLSHLI
ncbi:ATP-binding cassette domain-containing protein [Gammaproteobacteria bacterium]|nr:ATP-binding cassette domain-containing protein [Gammaproteobacteria bacterium]